jgi:hypothetical protein
MANVKISNLTAATTPVAGTEVLPIVQSGATVKVSIANLTAGRSVSATGLALAGSTSGTVTLTAKAVAGSSTFRLPSADGTSGQAMVTDGSGNLSFATASASQWTTSGSNIYYASGNVGINTSSTPDAFLQVYAAAGKAATFGNNVNNNGNYIVIGGAVAQKNWVLSSNMLINAEFGIGRTSANGGTTIGTTHDLYIDLNGNTTMTGTATAAKFIPSGSSATGNGIYLPAANSVGLSTNGAERFRMDSTGNAFFSGNYTVAYPGNGNTTTGIFLESSGQFCASRDNTVAGRFNRNSTDGTLISCARQGTEVGTIGVTTSATSYNTSSDYRLKNTIAPMTGALAKVAALKPVTYKWNVDGSDGEGFIAHELAEVCPNAVTGEKDGTQMQAYEITPAISATYDEDGNELTPAIEAVIKEREIPKYQGIDTSFLVATLTAAIQEQQALITQLQADVAALKGS